jgi:hypothetical protein
MGGWVAVEAYSRRFLAALGAAALLGCVTATETRAHRTPPSTTDVVFVQFTGDGYVNSHDGAQSDLTAAAFWQSVIVTANSLNEPTISIDLSHESGGVEGYASESYANALTTCGAQYELLQQLHPADHTASGAELWTSSDHGSYPDPGEDAVLVTGAPFWGDYQRISKAETYCSDTTAGELQYLAAR